MGVPLSPLVQGAPIALADLAGRAIAIDAYNTLYQFLATIRDRMTGEPLRDSRGRVTSHLSGLFYRSARLLEAGIRLVYVFDGTPPAWKRETLENRGRVKQEAERKLEQARKAGDTEGVRRYAQATSRLTKEMAGEAKELLAALGIPWVQAPSEGEAQAVRFQQEQKVWAVGSQDWDALLFGAERIVRNLTISGRKKVPGKELHVDVLPELVTLQAALNPLGITHDQLILLGILVGTDFNPGGVPGVGPRTALKLVKEHPVPERLQQAVAWPFPMAVRELFQFFKEPPTEDLNIPKATLDPAAVKQILVAEHNFSGERIGSALAKLAAAKPQPRLERFFGK